MMAPAAVHFVGGTANTVTNCTFAQLGAWGLAVTYGAQRTEVSHSTFTDCSGGGIYLGNVNETRASDSTVPKLANLLVQDNVVDGVGVEYQGSSGIHLFSAINASLQHNRVAHTPYTAMTVVLASEADTHRAIELGRPPNLYISGNANAAHPPDNHPDASISRGKQTHPTPQTTTRMLVFRRDSKCKKEDARTNNSFT